MAAAAAEKRHSLPPDLTERPELRADLVHIWQDFFLLSQFRESEPVGGTYRPLRIADLVAFLGRSPFGDADETDFAMHMMAAMDRVYLDHVNRKTS